MGNTFCFDWEISLLQLVQSAESPVMEGLSTFFTMLGEEYLIIAVVGLCYWCIDKRLGRNIALALVGAMLSGSLLQWLVLRRRPYMDYPEVRCLRAPHTQGDVMSVTAQGYSFPSLHATLSAGVYGTLAMNVKKKWATVLAFALPLCIGLSRIFIGVHYPTDVLCGWALGAAVTLGFYALERKYGYKISFLVQLVLGAAGFFYCRDNSFFTIYGVLIGVFLGFWFEEKYVGFERSKGWWSYVTRPLFGVLLFVVLSLLLKLPVAKLAEGEHMAFQFGYRCFRYALCGFALMGLYPWLFRRVRIF